MKTILIDDLITLLNMMKEKNGVKRVHVGKLAKDISNVDCVKAHQAGDQLACLIARCSFFAHVHTAITAASFPTPKIPVLGETRIYEFRKEVSSRKVQKVMQEDGFHASTMGEGLVWAKKHPNYMGAIVLLGQVIQVRGVRYVGVLKEFNSERMLDLISFYGVWPVGCRFLAVREHK